MKLAIASGKGGTGKTTVAVNLAWTLAQSKMAVCYLDCDVEEPNGHLFLKPLITATEDAFVPVPLINESLCDGCGECVRFCEYKALIRLGKTAMVFEELCHGCGGCMLVCPNRAITEKNKIIGVVEKGNSYGMGFVGGRLNVGQAMSPPLIRRVLESTEKDKINIYDAPPGTSCPVIAAVRNVDFVLLVTEPTPFGLHDLGLALDMVKELGLPHAVAVNRADPRELCARRFCEGRGVKIIAEIPDDRRIAEAYSSGQIICRAFPTHQKYYHAIWSEISSRLGK